MASFGRQGVAMILWVPGLRHIQFGQRPQSLRDCLGTRKSEQNSIKCGSGLQWREGLGHRPRADPTCFRALEDRRRHRTASKPLWQVVPSFPLRSLEPPPGIHGFFLGTPPPFAWPPESVNVILPSWRGRQRDPVRCHPFRLHFLLVSSSRSGLC